MSIPLKTDQTVYSLAPPYNESEVSTVVSVTIDGRPVSGWSGDYLQPGSVLNGVSYITNPDKLIDSTVNTISIDPTAAKTGSTMVVAVTLRPRRDLLFIPDMLGYDFFDTILEGVSARLQMHKGRPYSSASGADTAREKFLSGITRAREKTQARFGKLTVPWAYPQMAPGRRF
jgi:hypothetical protein